MAVVTAFTALTAVMAWGSSQLDVADTSKSFIPSGSYLLDVENARDEYFGGLPYEFEVVTGVNVNYFLSQPELAAVKDNLSGEEDSSPYIAEPQEGATFECWYDTFQAWAVSTQGAAADPEGFLTNESQFYSLLSEFLASSPEGRPFNGSVVWADSSHTSIVASKIQSQYSTVINYDAFKQVNALDDTQTLVRNDMSALDAYPWSYSYLEWEVFRVIYVELFKGVGVTLVAVVFIILVLISQPITALLVSLQVILTIIDLLGAMYFWGIPIDTVAVIFVVLAVGLSVDYAAHIGHTFQLKKGTRDERVCSALADIGPAVINGALSTFLATVTLAFSQSTVFQIMFKQFFCTVIFGVANGMLLLPVLLSLVGPPPFEFDDVEFLHEPKRSRNSHKVVLEAASDVNSTDRDAEELQ